MAKTSDSGEATFPVAFLVSGARDILGVAPYVAAGALSARNKDLSVAEAKAIVARWLNSPVKEA